MFQSISDQNQTHAQPERLLRLKQVLKIIPVSPSTWWSGVKSGRFPTPMKLGPKTTVWKESDIQALTEKSR